MPIEALIESEGPIFRNEDARYLHHCQLPPLLETWRGGGGAEGGGGDGVVVQEQLLDAEAEPPEEVLPAVRRRRLLPAAERGEEDALLAPGGGVLEAREQGPELGVGGVAGGRAPLEEGLHDGLGILLHAHAAHGWMDGWMEIERERERGSTAGQQPVVRGAATGAEYATAIQGRIPRRKLSSHSRPI